MRSRHRILLTVLTVLLALPAAADAAPSIVSASVEGDPLVGKPVSLVVVARDNAKPVTGLAIADPDGGALEESACAVGRDGQPPKKGALAPGRDVRFELPYTPKRIGVQIVDAKVTSGGCGAKPESTSTRIAVTVTLPDLPILPIARASAAGCRGADTLPTAASARRSRATVLCLLNAQRRAAGLPVLRTHRKLRDAAIAHTADMVRRGYFGHSGPGGPDFASRLKRFGFWPAVAGENLGRGPSTPAQMVEGWMRSEPHRTNILTGNFRAVGIAVLPSGREVLYTTDLARR